jgi:acetolactate synthase small subunit
MKVIRQYTLVVKDMVGVLNRITGYIRRNGWNVVQISVEPMGATGQSLMQIALALTDMDAEQFEQRLRDRNFVFSIKLEDKGGGLREE